MDKRKIKGRSYFVTRVRTNYNFLKLLNFYLLFDKSEVTLRICRKITELCKKRNIYRIITELLSNYYRIIIEYRLFIHLFYLQPSF